MSDRRWWQPQLGGPEQDWPAAWVLLLLLVPWGRHREPLTDWAARTSGHEGWGVGPGAASVSWRGLERRMKGALGPSKCLFGSVLLGKNNFPSVSVGAQEEAWLAGMAEWGLEPPFSSRVCVMPVRYRHSPPDPLAESLAWRARALC